LRAYTAPASSPSVPGYLGQVGVVNAGGAEVGDIAVATLVRAVV
jgi:hypothetical protein